MQKVEKILLAVCCLTCILLCYDFRSNRLARAEETPTIIVIHDTVTVFAPDTLTEWQLFEMAIMGVESEYVGTATSPSGYYHGYMQMGYAYIDKVNEITGMNYTAESTHDMGTAIDMFEAYQDKFNPTRDLNKALKLHNSTPEYRNKVLMRMKRIKRYENARREFLGDYAEFE